MTVDRTELLNRVKDLEAALELTRWWLDAENEPDINVAWEQANKVIAAALDTEPT